MAVGRTLFIVLCIVVFFFEGKAQEFCLDEVLPDYTFDEVADRMSCIQNEVPLNFNDKVLAFIDYFSLKRRKYLSNVIKKKELYFPIFSSTLSKYNMPDELKYLAVVESGLRPDAISKANAVGLWQFISSTGKIYGLNHNWYVDERMDPHKATDAACRHLLDLYNVFDDWELALAAYNCGSGNVKKAIKRIGYKKSFWEIYQYLPRETRSYVPQYVAITYLFNHLNEHGFSDKPERFYPQLDTIQISQYFHIETFCNQLGLCPDDVLLWNPQIKRGALPEGTKNFALNIPSEWKDSVVLQRNHLYDTASKVGKKHLEYLARNTSGSTYGRKRVYYRVRSGDVLGTIARQHRVKVSDIKSWNRLRSNMIRIGQRLSIWVLPSYNSKTKNLYTSDKSVNKASSTNLAVNGSGEHYTVKSGDSLWSISKDNNTTIEKLKAANKLASNMIKPGQSLFIPN